MRKWIASLLLLVAPVPAGATIRFNSGTAMTADGSFTGSKRAPGGGVILHVTGTFDGASVALEVNGGNAWIAADTCAAMATAQICRAAVGPVDLRITISSAGAGTSLQVVGFEAEAVISSKTGSVTADVWDGSADLEIGSVDGTAQLILPPSNSLTAPPLIFGDPTTGLYRPTADRIGFAIAGAAGWEFSATALAAFTVAGPQLSRITPTSTLPSLVPIRTDSDSGIGTSSGGPAMIDESTEILRAVWDGSDGRVTVNTVLGLAPRSSAPGSPVAGEMYYDSDNSAPCVYTGAGFVQINDLSTPCT